MASGALIPPDAAVGRAPDRSIEANIGATLLRLLEAVSDTPPPQRGLEATAELLVNEARTLLTDTDCYLAIIPLGRADRWRVIAGAGLWAETLVGQEYPLSGTLFARAVRSRRPVESTDLRRDTAMSDLYLNSGIRAGRLVPLAAGRPLPDGRIALGVLSFWRRDSEPFSQRDRALMDLYASFAGVTIAGVEDRQAAERTAARLRGGIAVATELGSTLDANVIIRSLVERAAHALDADRAALLTVDDGSLVLQGSFDVTGGSEAAGTKFKMAPALKRLLDAQTPALAPYEPRILHSGAAEQPVGMQQSVTVPLVVLGHSEGLLTASRQRDEPFNVVDAETLQQMGGIALLALRNASLYREAQRAREQDRAHAERMAGLEELKSHFLNLASHELRGPLAILRGYMSMLSDGTLSLQQIQGLLPLLQAKLDQMGMLVNKMLETARLEDERLELHLEKVDLRRALNLSIRTVTPVVPASHRLLRRVPPAEVTVRADLPRIETVITNLLDNAIKYSPDGGRIAASITVIDGSARLTITDHGLGIAREDMPKLFTRFGRLVTKDNSHISGTGLGLYLSRQIARLHGGDIIVRSRLGKGSSFTLVLPTLA